MRVPAVLAIVLVTLSCNPADPPLPPPQPPPGYTPMIALSVVDSGLTDVLLRVQIPDTVQERFVEIVRDGGIRHRFRLISADTVLRDDSLLINRLYHYRAYRMRDSVRIDSSQLIGVQTLDTTSHDFTWQTQELGDGSSSALYDIAIINDTLAYAVGEIYLRDSTGTIDPTAYSIAIWNGSSWTMKRLYYGGTNLIPRIRGVFAFHPNDVWLAAGSIFQWDGVSRDAQLSFSRLSLPNPGATVEKLWGTSITNLYGVGNAGTVVHKSGASWRQLESGTGLDVYDIHGGKNALNGEMEVYAVAAEQFVSSERRILRIQGDQVTQMSPAGISSSLNAIWFEPGRQYYVAGSGMYTKKDVTSGAGWQAIHPGVTTRYLYGMAGERLNNIVACGSRELLHFNGSTWKSFRSISGIPSSELNSCAVKGDLLIAVGFLAPRGFVVVGKRTR